MSQLRIKQGATFLLTIVVTDALGAPLNLGAATLASTLRTSTGVVVEQLAITPTGTPGQASVLATDTSTWPVGILSGDISITGSGLVSISQSFTVYVEKAMTQ